jgi:hypothetical protein
VDGDATQEDEEQDQPLELLEESTEEGSLAGTVAQRSTGDVVNFFMLAMLLAEMLISLTAVEHNDKHDPNVPRADVVLVDVALEPADNEVVDSSQQPGSADSIVGTDVGDDIDLGAESHVGADELAEQRCERAAHKPEADRVEHQLVTPVGVLLPAGKFVVDLKLLAWEGMWS